MKSISREQKSAGRTGSGASACRKPMELPSSTLVQLGWKPFFNKQVSAEESAVCQPVRVMSVHRGMVTVAGEGFEDSISSSLPAPEGPEDRPTVGDWLLIDRL